MKLSRKKAIETLRWNIEYTEGRFLEDDGTAADDEFRMSLDAMKNSLDILKQQPPAGEFTKECRKYVLGSPEMSGASCRGYAERLLEACDIIDRAEAINKDLLTACEAVSKLVGDFRPDPETVTLVENAIARAKIKEPK